MNKLICSLLMLGMVLGLTGLPTTPLTAMASEQAWQSDWEKVLEAAKKEGKVSVYAQWGPEARVKLGTAFKATFGIDVEFTSFGKGAELVAKLQNERRAGLHLTDVLGCGASTMLGQMNPQGMLAPMEPMLILPEVRDAKVRVNGRIFLDKGKKVIPLSAEFYSGLTCNTGLVKEGDIKSYYEVLDPKWKGKIVFNDPTVGGQGYAVVSMLLRTWGEDKTKDYLRQLVEQEPVINRNLRVQVEWLAKGKYALGLGLHTPTLLEFKKMGAPVANIRRIKEGGVLTPGAANLGLPEGQLPHPNAARVFINWLLTKEGQTLFSKVIFQPSSRKDVPHEGLEELVPLPGESFKEEYNEEGVALLMSGKTRKISKEILAPVMK